MKLKNAFLLMLAAFIWGIAFVAQSSASEIIKPFTFNGLRSLLGAFALLPLLIVNRKNIFPKKSNDEKSSNNIWLIAGISCGFFLLLGSTLQQYGITYTTVGKAGFITALYIIFVPLASIFIFRKKMTLPILCSVILGTLGLYLLCMKESISLSLGDTYVLLCALAFTGHILVVDHFTKYVNGILISFIQFLFVGIVSLPVIIFIEKPALYDIYKAIIPILYAGLLSSGVGYTLQIVGQKDMNPTIASLILSLESVFSALAGWIILGQSLSFRETLGCVVMFAAILLATLGDGKLSFKKISTS